MIAILVAACGGGGTNATTTPDNQVAEAPPSADQAFLTLAGGRLGVVAREYLNDARDDETPERQDHDCAASCPDLDGFAADADFQVRGPAATVEQLLE
jgi:hypothetical protein